MAQSATREAPINLRAHKSQRSLIDKAASALGKNRSDFMLEASCRAAENVLLDQRLFQLDTKAYRAFEKALDAPIKDNPELRHLLTAPAPWEN